MRAARPYLIKTDIRYPLPGYAPPEKFQNSQDNLTAGDKTQDNPARASTTGSAAFMGYGWSLAYEHLPPLSLQQHYFVFLCAVVSICVARMAEETPIARDEDLVIIHSY